MSNIPLARDLLSELSAELHRDELSLAQAAQKIHAIMPLLVREAPVRRAAVRKAMRRGQAAEIRQYARQHPGAQLMEIAEHFDVNIGRVSEAMRRMR